MALEIPARCGSCNRRLLLAQRLYKGYLAVEFMFGRPSRDEGKNAGKRWVSNPLIAANSWFPATMGIPLSSLSGFVLNGGPTALNYSMFGLGSTSPTGYLFRYGNEEGSYRFIISFIPALHKARSLLSLPV